MSVVWLLSIWVALTPAAGVAPHVAQPVAAVADDVLAEVVAARAALGLDPLERRVALDVVALERALAIAELPHARRLTYGEPIGDQLRRSGVRWFISASTHLDMVRGYVRPAEGIAESWRRHSSSWEKVGDPRYAAIGVGAARAEDGWIVFVAVLLEDMAIPSDLRLVESLTFEAVNRERVERGLPELRATEKLSAVARAHSEDMAARDYVAHVNPEGLGLAARATSAGLVFARIGENIQMSRGADDPVRRAVTGWLESAGHRATMLDVGFVDTGIGVALDESGSLYFTQLFVEPARER